MGSGVKEDSFLGYEMLAEGATFERFRVEAVLGQGGMGRVYRAFDTRLERTVALKVLLVEPDEVERRTEAVARILREARAAAAIDHPNKVVVYDVGEHEDVPYIAMEYVSGVTLRRLVGAALPSWQRKLGLMLAAAHALDAAHGAGIVHRDVKPENVMIRDDGVVKVLDFGIARRVGAEAARGSATGEPTVLTQGAVGTPAYMAPEQLDGSRIDHRADQFSWAVTTYELLSGALPFGASIVRTGPPLSLRTRMPDLPPIVEDVVLRALARDPSERHPSLSAIAATLEPVATLDRRPLDSLLGAAAPKQTTPPRVRYPTTDGAASRSSSRPSAPDAVVREPLDRTIASPRGPSNDTRVSEGATREPRITGTRIFTSRGPLQFAVDAEARFARFPPGFTVKGMFFTRITGLGARYAEAVKPKLREPPRSGRYLPFADYPQVDYSRIAHAVAVGLYPNLPVPEAMRRLARKDFATFAASSIGRVTLALMGNAKNALAKLPSTYAAVLKGGTVEAREISATEIELTFRDFYGWVDCYPMGNIEGMVEHFGGTADVEVDVKDALNAVYRVTLR